MLFRSLLDVAPASGRAVWYFCRRGGVVANRHELSSFVRRRGGGGLGCTGGAVDVHLDRTTPPRLGAVVAVVGEGVPAGRSRDGIREPAGVIKHDPAYP